MKYRILLITATAGLFVACQSNTKTEKTVDSTSKSVVTAIKSTSECYTFAKNKDTAMLNIVFSGTNLTGTLSYNLYEKDKNSGTISGIVKGDTILADYTFNSEGKQSIRQVAFLKKGKQLLEGFGDVEDTDGRMAFKNTAALKFENYLVFDQVECK